MNKIAVIGHTGMVGSTVYRWFKDQNREVMGLSLDKQDEDWDYINEYCRFIFVCVPTPFNWKIRRCDLSIIEDVFDSIRGEKVVIIKSTVPIGTTERMQERYPDLKVLFNPEFLSEKTAWSDYINPDRQFVGYTDKSKGVAHAVMNLLPESTCDYILPSKESEFLKYINNLHGMMEIMESNHYYEVCKKEGLDYDRIVKCMTSSRWVGCPMGRHYRKIWHNGKRGYGGKCFPKDVNAYLEYLEQQGLDDTLFAAMNQMNKRILEEQGLSESDAEDITYKNPKT